MYKGYVYIQTKPEPSFETNFTTTQQARSFLEQNLTVVKIILENAGQYVLTRLPNGEISCEQKARKQPA
jgi:hypothetical protein